MNSDYYKLKNAYFYQSIENYQNYPNKTFQKNNIIQFLGSEELRRLSQADKTEFKTAYQNLSLSSYSKRVTIQLNFINETSEYFIDLSSENLGIPPTPGQDGIPGIPKLIQDAFPSSVTASPKEKIDVINAIQGTEFFFLTNINNSKHVQGSSPFSYGFQVNGTDVTSTNLIKNNVNDKLRIFLRNIQTPKPKVLLITLFMRLPNVNLPTKISDYPKLLPHFKFLVSFS